MPEAADLREPMEEAVVVAVERRLVAVAAAGP